MRRLSYVIVTILSVGLMSLAVSAAPATQQVDCDAGGTIMGMLPNLNSGDTLQVGGTCNESVIIPYWLDGITLDGQSKATIKTADTAPNVIQVLGRGVTIKGFTLTGGRNGITVVQTASAIIDSNTIQNTGAGGQPGSGLGINVAQGSYAAIVNNTIQNNRIGILVHERSAARIGFIDIVQAGGKATNTIQNNATTGILIDRGAEARVTGAVISGNKGSGILVQRGSYLEAANNLINANGGNGIEVRDNAGVVFEIGDKTVTEPNRTDATGMNAGWGLSCSVGGAVTGPLGTLSGAQGAKSFDTGCVDNTK